MADINRRPDAESALNVHKHVCPNCQRPYDCNCHTQPDKKILVCTDCETGRYDPAIHGGQGQKSEA